MKAFYAIIEDGLFHALARTRDGLRAYIEQDVADADARAEILRLPVCVIAADTEHDLQRVYLAAGGRPEMWAQVFGA